MSKVKCPHCGKEYAKKGIATHIWRTHSAGKDHNPNAGFGNGTRQQWNTGLSKETNDSVKKQAILASATHKKQYRNGTRTANIPSAQVRQDTSERMSLHNPGGKCKWYKVNGTKVQGTWERDIALILEENNISWIKPTTANHLIRYDIEGQTKSYTPDFYLKEYNVYLEIKGHWWGNDRDKMDAVFKQHPEKNIVLIEGDLFKKLSKKVINIQDILQM